MLNKDNSPLIRLIWVSYHESIERFLQVVTALLTSSVADITESRYLFSILQMLSGPRDRWFGCTGTGRCSKQTTHGADVIFPTVHRPLRGLMYTQVLMAADGKCVTFNVTSNSLQFGISQLPQCTVCSQT